MSSRVASPEPDSAGTYPAPAISRAIALARPRAWATAVWVATFAWAIAVCGIVRDRYLEFRYARFDLGNMVQAVWNTAHGHFLESTHGHTGEQAVRLGSHVDPILAALAPVWIVVPSPLTLAAVQVLAVASAALPVFWLARRHLGSERSAALLAVAYLAYPWTVWAAVDAFHPVALAVPLFLLCLWFLDTDRLVPFAACALLALTTGELMGLPLAAIGIWYALARRRWKPGLAIAAVGAGWTMLALTVVVPAFAGESSVYYGAFDHVGGSPTGLLRTAFTDPLAIVSASTSHEDLTYLLLLALPLGGLFVLSPGLVALAAPQLAVNLLADDPGPTDPHEHYVSAVIPFLFAAIVFGLARLSPASRRRGVAAVLVLSVAGSLAVGPWPRTVLGVESWTPLPTSPQHVSALQRAVELVPDGVGVVSTNRAGSHLAARRYVYSAPTIGDRAEWIVLESADTWIPGAISGSSDPGALRRFQEAIEGSPAWLKVFDESGVMVFRKARE